MLLSLGLSVPVCLKYLHYPEYQQFSWFSPIYHQSGDDRQLSQVIKPLQFKGSKGQNF